MKDYMTKTITMPVRRLIAFLETAVPSLFLPRSETDAKQFATEYNLPQEVADAIVVYMQMDQQDRRKRGALFKQLREPALKLPMQQRAQVFQTADAFVRYGTPETVKDLLGVLENVKMKGVKKLYIALKPWMDNE